MGSEYQAHNQKWGIYFSAWSHDAINFDTQQIVRDAIGTQQINRDAIDTQWIVVDDINLLAEA